MEELRYNVNNKIDSLQVLRCFAFLGIFICHTGLNGFQSLGAWGVSVFIVLSGFLMVYNYLGKERIIDVSVKNNLIFAIKKIGKLYPLHIMTMLAMLVFSVIGEKIENLLNILLKVVLNVLLIQEWFPLADREINGMSWFLCITLFFYFVFPWILKKMEFHYSVKKAYIMIAISILIIVLIGVIGSFIPWGNDKNSMLVEDFTRWIVYYLPTSRFWEFFIGCNLGYVFVSKKHEKETKIYSTFEILAILLVILSNIVYMKFATPNLMNAVPTAERTEKWWMFVLIFIFSTSLLIYVFAIGKGKISRILTCNTTMTIAKYSPFTFLVHTVVFRYLSIIYYHIPHVDGEWFYYTYGRWINLTIGFFVSIGVAILWDRMTIAGSEEIKRRRKNYEDSSNNAN